MALNFAADGRHVNCGSGSSIDDLTTFTMMWWLNPTSLAASSFLASKTPVGYGTWRDVYCNVNGQVRVEFKRATTGMTVYAVNGTLAAGAWQCIAVTWDGSNAAKIYKGTLAAALAEASYATSTAGSGAYSSDAAEALFLGAGPNITQRFNGSIAWVGLWNREMTLAELQSQQFRPRVTSGCVGFWMLGANGTATQADWSGNGNSGSVTGATVADHVPLGSWFGGVLALPYVVAGGTAYNETGGAVGAWTGSATDTETFSDAGAGRGVWVASGSDAATFADSGRAVGVWSASVDDVGAFLDAGSGRGVWVASGLDVALWVDAGAVVGIWTGGAADSFGGASAYHETGGAVGIWRGTLVDVLAMNDIGQATGVWVAGGVDALAVDETAGARGVWVASGLDAWGITEAGGGVGLWTASGADALMFVDSGAGRGVWVASGADIAALVDSGGGIGIWTGGGLDALVGLILRGRLVITNAALGGVSVADARVGGAAVTDSGLGGLTITDD